MIPELAKAMQALQGSVKAWREARKNLNMAMSAMGHGPGVDRAEWACAHAEDDVLNNAGKLCPED